MTTENDQISHLVGKVVIVDTATPYLYAGTLKDCDEHFLVLTDADVHDTTGGGSSKEMYALEARRHGVQKNRREVWVRMATVVSLSRLDDVVLF